MNGARGAPNAKAFDRAPRLGSIPSARPLVIAAF
jgi:hypothetical protein